MNTVEKTLEDGTVVRLSNPNPPLPPYARYLILRHLYKGVVKRRLDALKSAWRGTSFLTWISLSTVPGKPTSDPA